MQDGAAKLKILFKRGEAVAGCGSILQFKIVGGSTKYGVFALNLQRRQLM